MVRALGLTAGILGVSPALSGTADAQAPTRRATNIAALKAYPGFFHFRPILVVGTLSAGPDGELRVADATGSLPVVARGSAPEGVDEIRGEFWDLGRMKADDPRLAGYDVRRTFQIDPEAAWPRPGEATAIIAATVEPAGTSPAAAPSIRAIVLDASRYLDQKVTVTGQYRGRNLMGDVPAAPARSRWDFVLRSADAAVWIVNIQPKGKDHGKAFQLGLDSRVDTSHWLQVSGTVQRGRGLVWIDGQGGSLALAQAPAEAPVDDHEAPPVAVPASPPPEVVFSLPTEDETGVARSTNVRIQFSRNLDPATLNGNVRVAYVDRAPAGGTTPPVAFGAEYNPASRVVELRFADPFEPFRTVRVQLLEGILGIDQQPLKPWTLTFSLGAS